mmetsp:Transcript_16115/g.54935  ORF Transcript_16115/g.54935 Transcript_16115/m.54935 type:complete len:363 (-) Transcript_16115:30-1118(-)
MDGRQHGQVGAPPRVHSHGGHHQHRGPALLRGGHWRFLLQPDGGAPRALVPGGRVLPLHARPRAPRHGAEGAVAARRGPPAPRQGSPPRALRPPALPLHPLRRVFPSGHARDAPRVVRVPGRRLGRGQGGRLHVRGRRAGVPRGPPAGGAEEHELLPPGRAVVRRADGRPGEGPPEPAGGAERGVDPGVVPGRVRGGETGAREAQHGGAEGRRRGAAGPIHARRGAGRGRGGVRGAVRRRRAQLRLQGRGVRPDEVQRERQRHLRVGCGRDVRRGCGCGGGGGAGAAQGGGRERHAGGPRPAGRQAAHAQARGQGVAAGRARHTPQGGAARARAMDHLARHRSAVSHAREPGCRGRGARIGA